MLRILFFALAAAACAEILVGSISGWRGEFVAVDIAVPIFVFVVVCRRLSGAPSMTFKTWFGIDDTGLSTYDMAGLNAKSQRLQTAYEELREGNPAEFKRLCDEEELRGRPNSDEGR